MTARTRVLIVDDEENQRVALRNILLREGYDAFCASHGEEALKILDQYPARVLLSDLKMPGMDGMELLARVMQRYPDIVFMFITAFPNELDTDRAYRQGVKAIISKPVDIDELLDCISRNLSTR
jgi:two-component system NtrC family response regulator/two-component system response regulator HydG